MNRIFKKRLIVESMLLTFCAAPYALAASLDLPTTPLITGSAVKPNMMLLLDSSGSMSNIVVDLPYVESDASFECNEGYKLTSTNSAVSVRIQSDGDVYFNYGGTEYDFGQDSANGASGNSKRCFDDDLTYNEVYLYANSGSSPRSPSGYASAAYTGDYLNWYFNSENINFGAGARKKPGTYTRMEVAKVSAKDLINGLDTIRVGLSVYNNGAGAKILSNMADLSPEQKTTLNGKIDAISNSGSTPLAESLQHLGRYFALGGESENLTIHPGTADQANASADTVFGSLPSSDSGSLTAPIEAWCQQSFIVAMTDGLPMSDTTIQATLQDYDGDCSGDNLSNCNSDDRKKTGYTYLSGGSDYADDVIMAMHDIDLRPDLAEEKNNVSTYVIGFADAALDTNALMVDMARAGTGGDGTLLTAANSTDLLKAFQSASQNIFAQVAAMTAVSFNTSELSADSALYQAGFNTAGWKGSLKAFELSDAGAVATTASWDAGSLLDDMASADRNIFTYTGSSGIEFTSANFASLSTVQKNDLLVDVDGDGSSTDTDAKQLLNYIRGDKSNEGSGTGKYRVRSNRLGDIVNSTSVYVGKPYLNWPDYGSNDKFGATDKNYSDFKTAKAGRTPMIYVGANDGMLHGFNAELTGTNKGKEKFAYIPNMIASSASSAGLHYLADKSYAHQFYVDLTPIVSDVYIGEKASLTTKAWRSVLIGGLRSGGKGLFALDVTDPDNFGADDILWEFESTATGGDEDFGYSYSKPTVAMMANGKWAVIVGNGYNNSGDGKAKLFILFIEDGLDGWDSGDYIEIDTGVGDTTTPNGLSTPTVVDTNHDGVADRVYAGDLQGNMWAFDVSHASNTNNWAVAYKSGNTPKPLFTARNGLSEVQPITTAPSVTKNPNLSTKMSNSPNLLVFFGTGKYLEASDVSGNQNEMSYYSVLDNGSGIKTRSGLTERTLTTTGGLRKISGSTIDWSTKSGWYIDLPVSGERVISDSLVRNKVLFFNTVIPSGDVCSSGGESWLMSLSLDTGLAPSYAVFDANGDGIIDSKDAPATPSKDIDGDGDTDADDGDLGYVGQSFDNGLASESGILGTVQYTVGSTGILEERDVYVGEGSQEGRLSWQELIRE